MPKDYRHHIMLSKHELDKIQMCIRNNIEWLYRNTELKTLQNRIELESLIKLSNTLEERWFKK